MLLVRGLDAAGLVGARACRCDRRGARRPRRVSFAPDWAKLEKAAAQWTENPLQIIT